MHIAYFGRGLHITDELRDYAAGKLRRAERFLEEPVEIRVTLQEEGHRRIAEIHAHHRFGVLQAEEESGDLRQAIHDAADKLEKQARRSRKKFLDRRRRSEKPTVREWPVDVVERSSLGGGEERPRIIKSATLSIHAMSLDDAAEKLEGDTNDFLVFRDAEHGRINVLYKRRDGNYGLISPEV